jgi:Tfp pilus assembly protein PilX
MKNSHGMALVVGLLLVAILVILGGAVFMMTTTDIKIGGHYKTSKKAFYAAEAGIEEARERLRTSSANPITDAHPTQVQWRAYIGSSARAQGKGYDSGNAMHVRVNSIQTELDYTVSIRHQTNSAGNILYWGDANRDGVNERSTTSGAGMNNIYLVTSDGIAEGASRTIVAEVTRMPPVNVPGALTVNAPATIQGSSTNVIGTDACGSSDLPGIVTSQAVSTVTQNGSPTIAGTGGSPSIVHTDTPINVRTLIDSFKGSTTHSYSVSGATHTAGTTPGPGDGWGTPTAGATQTSPSSCGTRSIVHYNTNNSYVTLSGGVGGCGILMIDGDVYLHGNFSWYGVVLATGSVIFTGGGNKNLTGALLSGGSTDADVVGGNANIIYCSSAVNNQTDNLPLRVLSWKDQM